MTRDYLRLVLTSDANFAWRPTPSRCVAIKRNSDLLKNED
jgi:hypothetical protein